MTEKSFRIFSQVTGMTSRRELAETLSQEILKFSIYDLQIISARLEKEINDLPSPYKEKIRPYFIEQYFGRYNKIVAMQSSGELNGFEGEIKDPELFRDYCSMIVSRFHVQDTQDDEELIDAPFNSFFYYLISAFYMFVMDEPGHPTGMPFPGGFKVQARDGVVYCTIRDKEKDVEYSICNFCPAKQDEVL
jgi:uncharacterized protein (UPF0305 family)